MFKAAHARLVRSLKGRLDSELFTYEQLRGMFIPLLLDQLFIFGIGILSSAMVSSSGAGAITAMTYAGSISNLAFAVYSALSVGTGIVIARAKGSTNALAIREAIGEGCVVCTLIGSVFGILLSLFGTNIVRFFYPSVTREIVLDAGKYLKYFGLSIIPYSLFNVIFAAFRSVGDTKSSLTLTLIINSVHLLCSLLYINGLGMGVAGSGLSFLTARVIGTVFAMFWLMRSHCGLGMRWRDFLHFDPKIARDIVSLGIPISIEQVLFQGGMLIVSMFISKMPVAQTDANGVANSMFMLYYVFGYSLTNITNTVCGQCIGAKNSKLYEHYCRNIVYVGRFVLLFAILLLYPMTPLIMKLYAPSADAVKYVYVSLAISAFPMPLFWSDGFVIPTANRAAGDAVFTTVISLIALAIGRIGTGYILINFAKLGIYGIWLGQLVEWIFRAVVFRLRLRSGRWMKADLGQA
ncbi:MAG: hypothetical protein II920_06560 [Clostridia bacterium]|nr:hypothetical protein [Clostridia bacterium]